MKYKKAFEILRDYLELNLSNSEKDKLNKELEKIGFFDDTYFTKLV
jgi:hypothetical protein